MCKPCLEVYFVLRVLAGGVNPALSGAGGVSVADRPLSREGNQSRANEFQIEPNEALLIENEDFY